MIEFYSNNEYYHSKLVSCWTRILENITNELRESIESTPLIITDSLDAAKFTDNQFFIKTCKEGPGAVCHNVMYNGVMHHCIAINCSLLTKLGFDENEYDGTLSHEMGHIFNEYDPGAADEELSFEERNLNIEVYADYFSKIVGINKGLESAIKKYILSDSVINEDLFSARLVMLQGGTAFVGHKVSLRSVPESFNRSIQNRNRVFYHEIGHWAAWELNKLLFNAGNGVRSIKLIAAKSEQEFDYRGETVPLTPENYIQSDNVQHLPEFIGVLLYGCIFQTFFLSKATFKECFNGSSWANGKLDSDEFTALEKQVNGLKRKKIIDYVETDYLNKLRDSQVFRYVMEFEPDNVLIPDENGYSVDLEKLDDELYDFMQSHQQDYQDFIEAIRAITNSKLSYTNPDNLLRK